jgi:hypothetical protein
LGAGAAATGAIGLRGVASAAVSASVDGIASLDGLRRRQLQRSSATSGRQLVRRNSDRAVKTAKSMDSQEEFSKPPSMSVDFT